MRELLIVNNLKEAKFHGKQALGFERRFRLPAVLGAIRNSRLAVVNLSAPEADIKDLLEVHTREYLQKLRLVVEKSKETGKPQEFGDEVLIYPGTYAAASTAAGAGILAVNSIIEGSLDRAFIAVRSAGHHAEPEKAMGYCIFSNAAIAALYAYKKFAKKTAVVDLDIHSGNGTAKSLANREGVSFYELFLENDIESYPSPEQMPNLKAGNIVQVGLPSGTTGQEWLRVLKEKIIAKLKLEKPQLLIISMGFDCMKDDPIGGFSVTATQIAVATKLLCNLGIPIISFLEGGYFRPNLISGTLAHCKELAR